MKFKDVQTLESLVKSLSEYAGKPGPPTYSGGTLAKTKKFMKSVLPQKGGAFSKKQKNGPISNEPTIKPVPAKGLEDGTEFKDEAGEVAGTVISKVGSKPKPDQVVVQLPDGKYELYDPELEVMVDEDISHDILKKIKNDDQAQSNSASKRIKRLARKNQLREQGTEQLFEINFNQKNTVTQALDLNIKCGFEAETSWDGLDGSSNSDPDDMNWNEAEDRIYEEYGSSYIDGITESFREWIIEDKMYEYEGDIILELVNERKEDEAYIDDFIDSNGGPTSEAVARYKEDFEDNNPEEYKSRIEDGYEYSNWLREVVEEEYEDELIEWLEQDIRDNGEVFDKAFELAEQDYGIDDWISEVHGGMASMLSDHDIFFNSNESGLEAVGDEIRNWAQDNSMSSSIEVGEYHSGGINNDYWRVEDDSSIESSGLGAEIISPVYSRPREMLEEMKTLFGMLEERNVDTNRSTGLHVTMSLDPTRTGMTASAEVNKVKLAVLLGDKYLASTFGRENNSYAKSQYDRLQKKANELKADPSNTKTIEAIEEILEAGISSDKFSSINFKDQKDNESGYNLIEFRIGGGRDYHEDFPKIVKSVVRYATTLKASYTDDHRADYVKALFKLINNVGKIDQQTLDRAKGRENYEDPLIDVLKGFFSKDNYINGVETINRAFKLLESYEENSQPDADAEWKKAIADYESSQIDHVDESQIKNSTGAPYQESPAVRASKALEKAQLNYVSAVQQAGYDLSQNLNREVVNAKAIGVLRKSLAQFKLSYESLSTSVNKLFNDVSGDTSNNDPEVTFGRVKNGIDRLFKKDLVDTPDWLTHAQVDTITTGLWNGLNTTELWQDDNLVNLVAKVSNQPEEDCQRFLKQMEKDAPNFEGFRRRMQGDFFREGHPVTSKDFNDLVRKIKTYDTWDHAVGKKFDTRVDRTSYAQHSIEKMMSNVRSRIYALDKLKQTDPELHIKGIKHLVASTEKLIGVVDTAEDTRQVIGFKMSKYIFDTITEIIKQLRKSNFVSGPFDDAPAKQIYMRIQDYITNGFEWYYKNVNDQENVPEFSDPEMKKEMDARTDAIAEYLSDVDNIAQKIGFSSQASAIDNKLNQHNRGKEFKDKFQGDAPATVTTFENGGQLWVTKELKEEMAEMLNPTVLNHVTDHARFYANFHFSRSIHHSDRNMVFNVPHAHYFAALTAYDIKMNSMDNDWRARSASNILGEWSSIYDNWAFRSTQNGDWVKIHANDLEELGIEVIKKGDGREGTMPFMFPPVLSRKIINGPGGEPFEPTSASVWRINNPELDKKFPASTPDQQVGGTPDQDMLDDAYDKARKNHTLFNNMMAQGMSSYMQRSQTNDLVGFLNNSGNSGSLKDAVLQAITKNKEAGEQALTYDKALNLGLVAHGGWQGNSNESVSNTFEKLEAKTLEEQLLMLEKIDSSKINNIHSKLFERNLGRAELKTPERIQAFADKLSAGAEFDLAGYTGKIVLDPEMADAFYNAENALQLPSKLRTADGEIITYSALEKTADFGARTADADSDAPVKVSNKGEVAEGILGCGTFARLLVRPSAPVTSLDIENVIKRLPKDAPDKGGWHELTLTAQEVDNPIADFFTLTLNLKHDTYMDFIDPKKWGVMQQISMGVAEYVNDNLERYTNYFQANGKVDTVTVIADGVTGETDTKVDVFLTHSLDGGPEKTLQHFDMSVKVGSTKQMGQVGGGKQTEPLTVRYGILKEMWDRFNVDLTPIEEQFITADSVEQGYRIAYTEATKQLNSYLTSEEKEKDFLVKLLESIKFFATLNDDRVKLVQFTDLKAGGYYVLDFKKLDRMMDKDKVDLEAKMIETAKHPKITIFNKITGKEFLSVRMYQNSKGYIRNYIEKEKGLVELIKVRGSGMRKKIESVQETNEGIIKEDQFGINEFDVLSYIIGLEQVNKIFGRSSVSPAHDSTGVLYLKKKLKQQGKSIDTPSPWRETMLYYNNKIQPNNPNASVSAGIKRDMLNFAKEVANYVNKFSRLGEQYKDAKHDQDNHPDLQSAINALKVTRQELGKRAGQIRVFLKHLIVLIDKFHMAIRTRTEGVQEGAVPNNDTIRKLRQVLASPILTGDLKAQMTAYVCIPDPSMIRDFRAARAAYGNKHDIRSIVQGYAKMKLNKKVLKQL